MKRARVWLGRIGAAVAVASVGGCAPAVEPAVVDRSVPARFIAAPAAREAPALGRWWARFGSAELTQLVDAASAGNLDIAIAAARLEQADAQARIAGAALLPSVTADADASRSQSSGTTGRGVFPASRRTAISATLAASYEIDLWGRNRDLLRADQESARASGFAREVVRLSTHAAVANAYFALAAAQERLRIAGANLASAERILNVIRQRIAAGTATALDLAQQETLIANRRAALPALRQNAAAARLALALLVGRPPQEVPVRGTTLTGLRVPAVSAGLPSSLLTRRPDLRVAEATLASADADVEVARKAFLPSLQLTAGAGLASSSLATLLRPESILWSLAAGATQPIFRGGQLEGQLDGAVARRRETIVSYRRAIVNALVDVENALVAIREAQAREAIQRAALDASRRAFTLSEQRLDEGTIDLVTLLNTQAALFQTQDALVLDRLARLQAAVALFQALGGDFPGQGSP